MIVGTRGSKLALVQTDYIRKCLYDITGEEVEKNIIKTKGEIKSLTPSYIIWTLKAFLQEN